MADLNNKPLNDRQDFSKSYNKFIDSPKECKKKKNKKVAAVLTAAACGICLIGLFFMNTGDLTFDFDIFQKETEQVIYDGNGVHRISLYEPDWESDIFKNQDWLDKNRYITYTENRMSLTLVDYDYASCGEPIVMFGEYVDALMHGDAEKVNSFYTDSYFETHERFEKITMQKLYNMEIEFVSKTETTIDGKYATKYVYKFTYMIMENDGTFRDDLVSDAMKPQFYTVIDDGESIKISDISYTYSE